MSFGRVDTIIEKGLLKGILPYPICPYLEYLEVRDISAGSRQPDYPAFVFVRFRMEPLLSCSSEISSSQSSISVSSWTAARMSFQTR